MTDQLNHTVSEFHTIEALDSSRISEASLGELNHIIQNLLADQRTTDVVGFTEKLREHIRESPKAHNLDISQFGQDLVLQLYQSYRDSGYTGSIGDMFIAIEKDVEVGTHADMVNGWSQTKAVNTIEWQWRYNKHQEDENAHKELLDTFRPQYSLNMIPQIGIDYKYMGEEAKSCTEYPIDFWEDEGTVNAEICFNYATDIDADIFTLVGDTSSFRAHLHIVDTVTTIAFFSTSHDPLCFIRYDRMIPPAFIDRISVTFNKDRIAIRDLMKTFSIPFSGEEFRPHTLEIGLPIRKNLNCLRTLALYRKGITIGEQNFFLN